jgi:hypothetical protein
LIEFDHEKFDYGSTHVNFHVSGLMKGAMQLSSHGMFS